MNAHCKKIMQRGFNVFLFCSFQAHFFYISNSPVFVPGSPLVPHLTFLRISALICPGSCIHCHSLNWSIEVTVFCNVILCSLEAIYWNLLLLPSGLKIYTNSEYLLASQIIWTQVCHLLCPDATVLLLAETWCVLTLSLALL